MLLYMSSSNPPTEDPTEFNNLQFNPAFFNTDDGLGISQITADGRYLLKKQPDTAIALETFSAGINTNAITSFQPTTNMTIGSNLTTGDIIIGNTDTDTIVEGNLKPTNRITTSGLLAPTTSSSCALFNNLLTNNIYIGNDLEEDYGIQMGSNNGKIIMNGKNIQLATSDTSSVKSIAPLSVNNIKVLSGSYLDVGSNATEVQVGNEISSTIYLGGVGTSSVLIAGELTCKTYLGTAVDDDISLFTTSTGKINLGSSTTTTNILGALEVNTIDKHTGTSNVDIYKASNHNFGINLMVDNSETHTNGVLKIGHSGTSVAFKASSLTSEQVIPDLAYDSTLSTTKWVQDTIVFLFQGVLDNIFTGSNTFSGDNSFTGNSTCITQLTSNNSTRLASTAFVKSAIAENQTTFLASSPTFSGIVNFSNDSTCKTQTTISNSNRLASTAFVKNAIADNQTTFLGSSPTFSGTLTTSTIKASVKLQTNLIGNTAGTANFLQYIDAPTDTLYLLRPTQITTLSSSGILTANLSCSSILLCNTIQGGATTTDINIGTSSTNDVILGTATKLLKINSEQTTQGGDVFFTSAKMNVTTTSFDRRDGIAIKSNANGNQLWYVSFFIDTNQVIGQIGGNGSAVFYSSNSDRRLKENIQPMNFTLDKIMALKPSKFRWKATQKEDEGFIAQEVFKVFPEMKCPIPSATNGECDCPVDDKGNPVYYSLDYGKFTPQIIKALQEMNTMYATKIASLEERLSVLEGKT